MVRPYDPADLEWIADTANRAWRPINASYRKAYGDELYGVLVRNPESRKGDEMRGLCRDDPGGVFVVEEEGRRVAFIHVSLDHQRGIGVIGNNAVDPDCTLKGVGQQMYRFALDRFRREGMKFAHVATGLDEGHDRARRAYERAGFDISRSDISYYKRL